MYIQIYDIEKESTKRKSNKKLLEEMEMVLLIRFVIVIGLSIQWPRHNRGVKK